MIYLCNICTILIHGNVQENSKSLSNIRSASTFINVALIPVPRCTFESSYLQIFFPVCLKLQKKICNSTVALLLIFFNVH